MGIFDFFKKKKTEPEIQSISFEEIKESLSKKRQEIEEKQREPKKQIEESLSELIKGLEESMVVLENVSLKDKKAMEREKLIVKQNLNNFIYYLEKLISDLKELNLGYFETLINDINALFSEFEKKSIISFQKSTYLIGEELGGVRDNIARFFRSFNGVVKENKFLIEQMKTISAIKEKLNEIEGLKKIEYENKEIIISIEDKIKSLYNKIQEKKEEIASIKRSQEYTEQMNVRQELERAKTKLIIELQKLKEMIDFKALAKVYHSAQKQMAIIREYKDNFKDSFERYGPEKLLELVDIREINQEPIREKIDAVDKIRQEMDNIKIQEDITKALEKDIDYIKSKIAELISEKLKKEKLSRKFQENEEQIKKQMAGELKGLNLILSE
ncbi:MAG: hypothetical protein Q8N63_07615 [Nanoarchaeota archaeon]|nr:hypothetical protein [Nanoarchaeota archaeon]